VIKMVIGGVAAAALLSGSAAAAPKSTSPRGSALAWVVNPTETGCRVDLELVGRSGGVTPVSLISDGQLVSLKFFKDDLPARAFLPIRVDKTRFSNLMLRGPDGSGELVLSEETESAMRRGGVLGVAWLSEEPLSASLSGSEQGLADLRVCGAQTASRHRDRVSAELAARERSEAEARARALNEAQLAAVKAQAAAAEAQRRVVEESAARQRRAEAAQYEAAQYEAAQAERAYAESRQRAAYEEDRRRAYERERAYEVEDEPRWMPPSRAAWPPPRYYQRY
jgi:hypothetical protein